MNYFLNENWFLVIILIKKAICMAKCSKKSFCRSKNERRRQTRTPQSSSDNLSYDTGSDTESIQINYEFTDDYYRSQEKLIGKDIIKSENSAKLKSYNIVKNYLGSLDKNANSRFNNNNKNDDSDEIDEINIYSEHYFKMQMNEISLETLDSENIEITNKSKNNNDITQYKKNKLSTKKSNCCSKNDKVTIFYIVIILIIFFMTIHILITKYNMQRLNNLVVN
ncbi:hypothetical protein NUSPORA_00856 [Nucleospora cyclopteri]